MLLEYVESPWGHLSAEVVPGKRRHTHFTLARPGYDARLRPTPLAAMRFVPLASRLAALIVLATARLFAADLPDKEHFHLYFLVGQSNMAGRGSVEAQDKEPLPRVLMLNKAGEWVPAVDPLHFDKTAAGVGIGRSFAKIIAAANPGVTIGLIPAAVGGSPIDAWQPGYYYQPTQSHPWDDAIVRAKIALRSGTLKGILWHQGESDSNKELAPAYEAKLHNLIERMRAELNAPKVPFIVGQLGKFEGSPWNEFKLKVDQAHRELPQKVPNTAFVSAEGLSDKGDKTHFNSASYREFGKRYAEAYLKLAGEK